MDNEAVKVLLESQDRAFRTALEVALEQVHAKLKAAEDTAAEIIKSLEFSQAEISDLRKEVTVLRKSDSENKEEIEALQTKVADLENRLNYQEDYSRRNNLRITGFLDQGETTWEQTAINVSKLFENKLQLPPMKLERAHRIGVSSQSRPRPIVVRFMNFCDREAVLRNARKLKGTGIYINEDLCPASLETKKKQFPLLKKAREEGKIAFFRYTKLIIKEKTTQDLSSAGQMASSSLDGRDVVVRRAEAASGFRSSLAAASKPRDSSSAVFSTAVDSLVRIVGGDGAAGGVSLGTSGPPPVSTGDGAIAKQPLDSDKRMTTMMDEIEKSADGIGTRSKDKKNKRKN